MYRKLYTGGPLAEDVLVRVEKLELENERLKKKIDDLEWQFTMLKRSMPFR